jgi:hypothetical protein
MSVRSDQKRTLTKQHYRLDCDTITITVGQDPLKSTFKIHEDAICDRSEFFRRAMKPEWASMRNDPRTIDLPEDDPDAFSLYRTWLYSGKLAVMPPANTLTAPGNVDNTQLSTDSRIPDSDANYHTLAYAYVLGERLLDKPFKNAIADVYVLYARGNPPARRYYPSNEEIRILYDGTGEGSPIRQLLVDIWYCRGKDEWMEKDQDLPKEFLAAVVRELFKARGEGRGIENLSRPWKMNHLQYHEK